MFALPAKGQCLVQIAGTDDGQNWPEDLLAGQPHGWTHAIDDAGT
jgi:hypothetical protein